MKSEACPTCNGTGAVTDLTANNQGHAKKTCWDCGGLRTKLVPDSDNKIENLDPDDPRAMRDDEYEAERLGTVIFLIGASLIGLEIGVRVFDLGQGWTDLPPWYFAAVIAVVGLIAWRFRSIVATLTWLIVFGAILYWVGGFVLDTFF